MKRLCSKRENGQAMVEWALVFPIFLLLVCVVIDFSWLGYQQLLFEGAYQVAAWDFSLKTINPSTGYVLSDADIINGIIPYDYTALSPGDVIKVGGTTYPLGEGLRLYLLENAPGLLKSSWLSVADAGAHFEIKDVREVYPAGTDKSITLDTYQLKVYLEADLEYKVKLLTPVTKVFFPSGEKVLQKKMIRERIEKVTVKRQAVVPGGGVLEE